MPTKPLLRQNSELRDLGIHNWTLPAWVTRLPDGRTVNVCPQAGACVKLCYARNGTYNFPGVKAAHQRNLALAMDDLGAFATAIVRELDMPRFKKKRGPHLPNLDRSHLSPEVAALLDAGAPLVRIHDSGDFFSDDYLAAWAHIATLRPDVLFYAYTKEVSRWRRVVGDDGPRNLLAVFSLGGKEDHLLDLSEGETVTPTCSPPSKTCGTPATTPRRTTTYCAWCPRPRGSESRRTTSPTSRRRWAGRRSDRSNSECRDTTKTSHHQHRCNDCNGAVL